LHFAIYFFCTLLIASVTLLLREKTRTIRRFMTAGYTLTFIAIIDEYRQFLLIERSTEFMDAVYSIAGIWIAISLLSVIHFFQQRVIPVKRVKLFPIASLLALLIPFLCGLLLIDAAPSRQVVQEKEASMPVFNQSEVLESGHVSQSLKHEIYEIAFEKNTADDFFSNQKKKSSEELLQQYETYFNKLKFYASIKSDNLFNEAIEEYKHRDEYPSFSIFKYLKKYKDSGIGLQEEIDELFQAIYKNLEVDLEENGYSSKLAEPFLEQYKKEKRARVATILTYLRKEIF
jgi:cytochrome c biogenesis factor